MRDLTQSVSRQSFSVIVATALIACWSARAEDDAFWSAHVEPLLKERCLECHNPTKSKSGLDITSLQSMLKGGDRGAAVLPGRPVESNLYTFLSAGADPHMPPKRQLTEEQAGIIKTWIERLGATQSKTAAGSNSPSAASTSTTVKPSKPIWVPPARLAAPRVIDQYIELGLKARGEQPTPPADDNAFVRRVYLDLVGRIPTDAERRLFHADRSRKRREHLVDQLLASPEHPRHLRDLFDVVLMGRHGAEFEKKRESNQWYSFLESGFAQNRPWNELVRDLVVARPTSAKERGAVWFLYERQNNPQAMAEAVAPIVFGVQIKCAQCHDHMVAREIKQAHYWGMVAAFNRSKNVDSHTGLGIAESAVGGFSSFANLKKESQPAYLTFFNGQRVEEPWPAEGEKEIDSPEKYQVAPPKEKERPQAPSVPKFSRREALADAVTRENPMLARAFVTRLWATLMGRGIVHPVDLMDSKHPPSHPELLDWLARDFETSGYDIRRLIRNLVLTKTYQRDSRKLPVANTRKTPKNRQEPAIGESFTRALEKPLSAEQLFRSLILATGNNPGSDGKICQHSEAELRHAFVRQFPDLFAPEYNATLQQAMFLSNSTVFDRLLEPSNNNLAVRLATLPNPEAQVNAAFWTVFGRAPHADELQVSAEFLRSSTTNPRLKQFLWALLTSAEFQVNH